MKENTYLVKVYFKDLADKCKEVVFRCSANEIDDYTKKEVKMLESVNNRKATDVIIFMKVKDFK